MMKISYRPTSPNPQESKANFFSWRPVIRTPRQRSSEQKNYLGACNAGPSDNTIANRPPESLNLFKPFVDSKQSPLRPASPGGEAPLVAFQRVVGAPAPAAATAAAVAATSAAAERNSKNTRISPKYRPFLDAWDKGFGFNSREEPCGVWLQVTEGKLPPELRGTFFRNGPGRFSRGPDVHGHPYDGDGLVASVAFPGDGRAFFRSAAVRTLEHEAEDLAGRLLFRGAISSRGRGGLLGNVGNLTLRNAANAGVALQGGKLLALYPGGLPYALDPTTLATHGVYSLGGALVPGVPLSLGSAAADRALGRLNRMLGFNDRLPPALAALGGDACCARPRMCGVSGRRVFWSHRTLLAGMPVTTVPVAAAGTENEGTRTGDAERSRGVPQGRGRGRKPANGQREEAGAEDFDALAWIGSAVRWLRRQPQERFDTEITFWEVDPDEDLDPHMAPAQRLQQWQQQQRPQGQRDYGAGLEDGEVVRISRDWLLEREREKQGGRRRSLRYQLPGFAAATNHDIALTPNYYLLLQPPVHPEVLPYLLGESGPVSCLRWREEEPAVLHVIPRPGSEAERRGEHSVQLPLRPAVCVLHHVNAFEGSQPGTLVLDSVAYDSLPAVGAQPLPEQVARAVVPDAGCRPRLQRVVVDLPSATASRCPVPGGPLHPLDATAGPDRHLELPTFNTAYTGRKYRYVYGCSVLFEDASCGLVKADMETQQAQRWAPGPGYICLEPCFVPRLPVGLGPEATAAAAVGKAGRRPTRYSTPHQEHPDAGLPPPSVAQRQLAEDDGWVLVYGFDSNSQRSELLVFDAWAIMAGPVARLALPSPLPHGLYGTWTDEYFGPVRQ
ncbi:hypothetical protein Vretimale_13395 [Volvox reticuliferus]|uniref:Uncharacterized protein n=1 Tax=Volvox reticuliferus TaxID=1737510 RepID=A0A8J4LTI1_9CHLO|nr:hypothetical protein Vretimale_13395 [Volvox reticuliferus]